MYDTVISQFLFTVTIRVPPLTCHLGIVQVQASTVQRIHINKIDWATGSSVSMLTVVVMTAVKPQRQCHVHH